MGVVGRGRLGSAIAAALAEAGLEVHGPAGRGELPRGEAVLLCVPDAEIGAAAEALAGAAGLDSVGATPADAFAGSARLVGHTSGATPLDALAPAGGAAFGLHPLQTFTGDEALRDFQGVGCAIAGTTPEALAAARALAERLGMRPFELADAARPAYHAAASIASNFLVTLEAAAEEVAAGAGIDPAEARELLAPLVRRTVENWAALGPERALTGPVARGDQATVERQRDAVAAAAPDLLPLFDELVARTRALAQTEVPA